MLLSLILEKLLKDTENSSSVSYRVFANERPEKIEIEEITCSSKKCRRESVFVCIKGSRRDGNDFIEEAKTFGTRVFLSERKDIELDRGILIISNNARKTMAEIAKILFGVPKGAMLTVGVTGTKGKSTVCELLSKTLRELGIITLSVGTLGAYCEEKIEFENTTPDSSLLYPLIRRAYDSGAKVCVIEVSSQALKEKRVHGIEFDILAFTSFGIDHIGCGEHSSLSEYLAAKRQLFTSYGAKLAVVNYDDPYSAFFSAGIKEVIRTGTTKGADYKIQNIKSGFFGMTFSLCGINKSFSLSGRFNATNIGIAAAIAERITKKPLSLILDVMAKMRVRGRFECRNIQSRFAIIDYAHNEKSLTELILSIRELTKRNVIAVFGSVGERSKNRRRELSRAASSLADFSVITSDNPGTESPYEIAEEIYSNFSCQEKAKIIIDRREAIRYAFSISHPGDTILLLGKGHEDYMIEGGKRIKFSEREVLSDIKKYGIPGII